MMRIAIPDPAAFRNAIQKAGMFTGSVPDYAQHILLRITNDGVATIAGASLTRMIQITIPWITGMEWEGLIPGTALRGVLNTTQFDISLNETDATIHGIIDATFPVISTEDYFTLVPITVESWLDVPAAVFRHHHDTAAMYAEPEKTGRAISYLGMHVFESGYMIAGIDTDARRMMMAEYGTGGVQYNTAPLTIRRIPWAFDTKEMLSMGVQKTPMGHQLLVLRQGNITVIMNTSGMPYPLQALQFTSGIALKTRVTCSRDTLLVALQQLASISVDRVAVRVVGTTLTITGTSTSFERQSKASIPLHETGLEQGMQMLGRYVLSYLIQAVSAIDDDMIAVVHGMANTTDMIGFERVESNTMMQRIASLRKE